MMLMVLLQTRKRELRGNRARVAAVRGAAELRGGAGAGPRVLHGARAAVAGAGARAQRVQAARAALRLGRGRLVLATPPRALSAGSARDRRARGHRLTAPQPWTIRFLLGERCVNRQQIVAQDFGSASRRERDATRPRRPRALRSTSLIQILVFTKFWKI